MAAQIADDSFHRSAAARQLSELQLGDSVKHTAADLLCAWEALLLKSWGADSRDVVGGGNGRRGGLLQYWLFKRFSEKYVRYSVDVPPLQPGDVATLLLSAAAVRPLVAQLKEKNVDLANMALDIEVVINQLAPPGEPSHRGMLARLPAFLMGIDMNQSPRTLKADAISRLAICYFNTALEDSVS